MRAGVCPCRENVANHSAEWPWFCSYDFEGNRVHRPDVDISLEDDIVNIHDDDEDTVLGDGETIDEELFTGNEGASKTTVYTRCFIVAWPKRLSFQMELMKVLELANVLLCNERRTVFWQMGTAFVSLSPFAAWTSSAFL